MATSAPHKPSPPPLLPQRTPEQHQPTLSSAFGSLAAMVGLLSGAATPALAADFAPPPAPTSTLELQQTREFLGDAPLATAPSVSATSADALPEGTQWRYSE